MKAIVLREHGGIDKLLMEQDFPEPSLGEHDVLVRVRATTVNRIDLVVRAGYPGIKIPFPRIPGADIAGEIDEVGSRVKAFRKGERVLAWPLIACGACEQCQKNRRWLCLNWKYFGLHVDGSYAEYTRVPEESLVRLPEKISFEAAATLPVAGLTSYHALVTVGKLEKGETVLIWGGSGGLGTFAVQIAKRLGARVIATVGKESKRERIESLGADLVLNHYKENVLDTIQKFTDGKGVEVVLDSIGAETFPASFQLLKKGGRLLLCGLMTGREAPLNLHLTYLKHLSFLGLYLGEKHELEALLNWVSEGKIKPVIDQRFELSEAGMAHQRIESGDQLGKIVLLP
ncbi:zinc-binding dehydrogenase [Candidatus Acetothermia bacterium]|nr:zinc-binding dehydrogenase [Candidatus Acetothermia bacterium]MBI3643189.1 zinc-binding dehydrogenase [Candidatus Acetothermia bacterium]